MYCAISGTIPEEPVASQKTGHIFEKRLILKALIATNGKCPETNLPLSKSDLLPLQPSTTTTPPLPPTAITFPRLLSHLQNEWDGLMLESHHLRKELGKVKGELAHALYQYDAARRVIKNVMKERDEARGLLKVRVEDLGGIQNGAVEGVEAKSSATMEESAGGEKRDDERVKVEKGEEERGEGDGNEMVEDGERESQPDLLDSELKQLVQEKNKVLRQRRMGRKAPKTLATKEDIGNLAPDASIVDLYGASDEKLENSELVTAMLPIGPNVICGCTDGAIRAVVNSADDENKPALAGITEAHRDPVTLLSYNENKDGIVLSGSHHGSIKMWKESTLHKGLEEGSRKRRRTSDEAMDVEENVNECIFAVEGDGVTTGLDFNPTGEFFLVAKQKGQWKVHDTQRGNRLSSYSGSVEYSAAGFHPDGILFGIGTELGSVEMWDSTSMKRVLRLGNELKSKARVSSMQMSENGYSLITGIGDENIVRVWDLRKQNIAHEYQMPGNSGGRMCVALDSFGTYTAASAQDCVHIFDTKRGRKLKEISTKGLAQLAWGPDAKWLAVVREEALCFYKS